MKYKNICIEGNIGVGKTTLTRMLAKDFNFNIVLETFDNNPFLEKFYEKTKKSSLPLELFFLAERYDLLTSNVHDLFSKGIVCDFIFDKSKVFASNTLKEDEFKIFEKIFKLMRKSIMKPEILIYLHSDIKSLENNIALRGRSYEKSISNEYLKNINDTYFDYVNKVEDFPIVLLDVSNIDFKKNQFHFTQIKKILNREYKRGLNLGPKLKV